MAHARSHVEVHVKSPGDKIRLLAHCSMSDHVSLGAKCRFPITTFFCHPYSGSFREQFNIILGPCDKLKKTTNKQTSNFMDGAH